MRSRAEPSVRASAVEVRGPTPRRPVERALRVGSLTLLTWMLRISLAPPAPAPRAEVVPGAMLGVALPRLTAQSAIESLHVTLDSVPAASARDWLVALGRSGTRVSWSGPAIPATALTVEPVNEPDGGVRALVAAPSGSIVALRDAAGPIDSVRPTGSGASVRIAALTAPAAAVVGPQVARAAPVDSLTPRRVLVTGLAGWESKFVIAALEERGWLVDASIAVAPGAYVAQGAPGGIDTARYAAVLVLDSSASSIAAAIARFVRAGGGAVLVGEAARVPGLVAIAPGGVGRPVRAAALAFAGAAPRRALGFRALESLRRDAVVLEVRDGAVPAAARRAGAGRVVQVGYDESWRWRMTGDVDAPAAHGDWWSAVVGSAASRASHPVRSAAVAEVDAAPLAALFAALGAPSPRPTISRDAGAGERLRWWMFAALVTLLLAEWASRRTRGAP